MTQKNTSPAILDLAFRPFFLLGSVFSILALIIWGATLYGWGNHTYYGYVQLWHGHEMLFGFVAAIMVGFLLTAVQNWTGLRSVHGKTLIFLIVLWLAGRLAVWFATSLPWWLLIVIDCSFLLCAACLLATLLWQKKQKRNYFVVLALLILMANNLIFHLAVATNKLPVASNSLHGVILLITLMMTIIGGRIIPMFTANTTQVPPRARRQWLDNSGLILLWIMAFIYICQWQDLLPDSLLSLLFLATAILIAARCAMWRLMTTWRHALLWSLHLSYWFIPLGLLLLACHYAGMPLSMNTALHALTVGAMGGLTLSMMSRVSLGHTGRPIIASRIIGLALAFIFIAALCRVGLILISPAISLWAWWLSITLWTVAFLLFLYRYTRILLSPRVISR